MEQEYEVLVIDDLASYLTPRLVERIARTGRKVIGVYDADLSAGARERLLDMGIDAAVETDASPDEFLSLIASLATATPREAVDEILKVAPIEFARNITAVVGDDLAGDVAIVLASRFASERRSTAVIDADTVNPMLAQRLSMPLVPNLLTALDSLVQLRGNVEDSVVATPLGVAVLAGLPETSEWETLRASDVVDLVNHLGLSFDELVVKLSAHIEDLSQFGGRAGRFEVSRSILRVSGDVLLLARPTPIGLSRALAWIVAARQISEARIHVVFGEAPSSRYQRGELTEELTRTFVPSSITWLPRDEKLTRATWNGEPVTTGPFTKAVSGLASALTNGLPVATS